MEMKCTSFEKKSFEFHANSLIIRFQNGDIQFLFQRNSTRLKNKGRIEIPALHLSHTIYLYYDRAVKIASQREKKTQFYWEIIYRVKRANKEMQKESERLNNNNRKIERKIKKYNKLT